jgi:HEPN domain-containing protein
MNAALDEARQLLHAATRDQTSFELLLGTGRAPHETLGFLAQQACEKLIKAVLVFHGARVERTHDLERLFDLAMEQHIAVPVAGNVLRRLNPYAVALRYESTETIWMTEADAVAIVETLQKWAHTEIAAGKYGEDA